MRFKMQIGFGNVKGKFLYTMCFFVFGIICAAVWRGYDAVMVYDVTCQLVKPNKVKCDRPAIVKSFNELQL